MIELKKEGTQRILADCGQGVLDDHGIGLEVFLFDMSDPDRQTNLFYTQKSEEGIVLKLVITGWDGVQ